MIEFNRFQLNNGLKVLIHSDYTTPIVSSCITYDVGTRDEHPSRTGFAHLFEHLMFGGSKHAPDFDKIVQKAGGENNAYTNQDITVYYETFPKANWELALFLEADRMQNLILNQQALDIQKKVVVEEFKETCLNRPYGDIWHHLGKLAYTKHPYRIPTIGETFNHIEQATLNDVQAFWETFYCPNNAVLTLSGPISAKEGLSKVQYWFDPIQPYKTPKRQLPQEPIQTTMRSLHIDGDVQLDAIYLVFHGASRTEQAYYEEDILSDILAEGDTARLPLKLTKKNPVFHDIDAYITGTEDRGLFVIEGRLTEDLSFEDAYNLIWEELEKMIHTPISEIELDTIQNRIEHNFIFEEVSGLNKALTMGYFETLGHPDWINTEPQRYQKITPNALQQRAKMLFQKRRCSVLYYKSKS